MVVGFALALIWSTLSDNSCVEATGSASVAVIERAISVPHEFENDVHIDAAYDLTLEIKQVIGGHVPNKRMIVKYYGAMPIIGNKYLVIVDDTGAVSWLGSYGQSCLPNEVLSQEKIQTIGTRAQGLLCSK